MAEHRECEYFGIDPKIVEAFERRIKRLLSDMEKHELSLFLGSTCSIRANDYNENHQLIVAVFNARNVSGGCGACSTSFTDDGMLRGE